jgi:hypothetical protein
VASTRRRRRRLPPGVTSLTVARADRRQRSARVDERTPAG